VPYFWYGVWYIGSQESSWIFWCAFATLWRLMVTPRPKLVMGASPAPAEVPVIGITQCSGGDRGLIHETWITCGWQARQVPTGNSIDGRFDDHGRYQGSMADSGSAGRNNAASSS